MNSIPRYRELLGDELKARYAQAGLEAEPRTAEQVEVFERGLELTGDPALGLELLDVLEPAEGSMLQTLDQVARVATGADLAPLAASWVEHPPTSAALQAAEALAAQVRRPGWDPGSGWEVERFPDRGPVWSGGSSSYSAIEAEPVSLEGWHGTRLRFAERHQFDGSDGLELQVKSSENYNYETLAVFDGRADWNERELDLSRFDGTTIELRFRRRGTSEGGGFSFDDLLLSGRRADLSRPLLMESEGSWTEIVPGTWDDSPLGEYAADAEEVLISQPVTLDGRGRPVLVFEAELDTESRGDVCHLEVRPRGSQDWVSLAEMSGRRQWHQKSVSLEAFAGQTVELRFRFTSDGSWQKEGVKLRAVRVEEASPAAPLEKLPVDGLEKDREFQHPLVEFLLSTPPADRTERYTVAAALAERTKSVEAALALADKVAPEEEQLEAAAVLWPTFKGKTPEALELLLGRPGLVPGAKILSRVGLEEFPLLRRRLVAGAENEKEAVSNLEFFAEVGDERVFFQSRIPVGAETVEARREGLLALFALEGEDTSEVWSGLTSWMAPQDRLGQVVQAYSVLRGQVGEDSALPAVREIRRLQQRGHLGEATFQESVERLLSIWLSGVQSLDEALAALAASNRPTEIVPDDEGVLIGDVWVGSRAAYGLHAAGNPAVMTTRA